MVSVPDSRLTGCVFYHNVSLSFLLCQQTQVTSGEHSPPIVGKVMYSIDLCQIVPQPGVFRLNLNVCVTGACYRKPAAVWLSCKHA